MYRYSLLNESEVDREKVLVADHACKVFCLELGIPEPALWFIRINPNGPFEWANPIAGFAKRKPMTIYITADRHLQRLRAPSRMSANTVGNSPKPISSWRISSWPSSALDERERELWTMRAAGESFHEITLRLAEIGAREALSQRNYECVGVGSSAPSDRSKRHRNADRRMYCALPRSILRTKKGRKIDDQNCPLADNSATQATTIVDIQDVPFSAPFPLFFRMS